MSEAKWKRFERLVAAIHRQNSPDADVRWDEQIEGRQFDVTIRFKFGLHTYLTVIECKDHAQRVSVDKVDALVTKARDVRANKAVVVSSNGFQVGCVEVAKRHGVKLLVLDEVTDVDLAEAVKGFKPGLYISDVRLIRRDNGAEHLLEDRAGRLAYVMGNGCLSFQDKRTTLNRVIDEWQRSQPTLYTDRENEIEIRLPEGAVFHIHYDESVSTTHLRFTCSLGQLAIPNRPMFDNHVLEAVSTRVELRDAAGNLEHSERLGGVELGFDRPLISERFYTQPAFGFHYYCEGIEGDTVHWLLVESYQHGNLIQAQMTQNKSYAGLYVEVTDERTLRRLRRLHAEFLSGHGRKS